MKLHLPSALRSALLACFAVACTTPAWADWDGSDSDTYTLSSSASTVPVISTADTTSAAPNGYFLRSSQPESGTDATINALTLTNTTTFNIQASWDGSYSYQNLTINSIKADGDLAAGTEQGTVNIAGGNSVVLGGVPGQQAADILDSHINITVDGTLNLDYNNWEALANQISASGDGGTIGLYGTIDATSAKYDTSDISTQGASKTFEDILGANYENLDLSKYSKENLTFEGSRDTSLWSTSSKVGYGSTLTWQDDGTLDLTITYVGTGCKTEYLTDPSVALPPILLSKPGDFNSTAETNGVLTQITNEETGEGGASWKIQVSGVIMKPTEGTADTIILTTADEGLAPTFSLEQSLSSGNFAIALTSEGKIILFKSNAIAQDEEAEKAGMATYWTIGKLNTSDWSMVEYSFTLSFQTLNNGQYQQLTFNDKTSFLSVYDEFGREIVTDEGSSVASMHYGYINVGKAIASGKLTESLYARLPEGSSVTITNPDTVPVKGDSFTMMDAPIPAKITWYVVENSIATVEGLQNGQYTDYDSGENKSMREEDTVVFAGGTLATEDYASATQIVFNNTIKVEGDGGVKLAPGTNGELVITYGEQALSTGGIYHGLEIGGGANSKVVLQNVTSTVPEKVTINAGGTLEIAGDGSYIFFDDKNDIKGSLGMDGNGVLYVIGKTDGSSTMERLYSTGGTVGLENTIALDSVDVATLAVAPNAAITAAGNVSATAAMELGNGVTLDSGASISAARLTLGNDNRVSAAADINVSGGTLAVGTDSTLDAGGTITAGSLSVKDNSTAFAAAIAADTNITATEAILAADAISAGGTITVSGSSAAIYTDRLTAANLNVLDKARVNIEDGTLSVSGTTTINTTSDAIMSDGIGITSIEGDTVRMDGLELTANTLKATHIEGAGIIANYQAYAGMKAVGDPADYVITAGSVVDSVIGSFGSMEVKDAKLTNTLVVAAQGTLTLTNTQHDAQSTAGGYDAVVLNNAQFATGGSILVGPSTTSYTIADTMTAVSLTGVATGTELTLTHVQADISHLSNQQEGIEFVIASDGAAVSKDNCSYTLTYAPGMQGSLDIQNGNLVLNLWDDSDNIMNEIATTENTRAAADVLLEHAPGSDGILKELYNYMRDTSKYDYNSRKAVLDALASGSITMMADSQRQGVTNTINRLRNRVVQMGNPQGIEPQTKIHAWIEADTNYNDIDQEGGFAGYEYQTYGGTVGAHVDMGNFSFGAAISAAYGDLTSHATDRAEGDHDSIALSAFVRHQSGNWTQMGILSLGRNELDITRHVSDYTGQGESTGHTITGYYEAGYSIALNEESTHVLQPLVSVMFTAARMGDFTENGTIGNAGLHAGTDDYFYGTVGLGARYQVVLAENVYERVSFLELRAKVVQDFGDQTDERTVDFVALPGQGFTVRGADVSRTGFQLGAGVSCPVGAYTTLFADVDADIRSGATSVGGSVGVRFEF